MDVINDAFRRILAQAEEEKRRMTAELHRSQSRVDSLTEMVRVLENGLEEERQEALHLGTALAESQEKRDILLNSEAELQEKVRLFTVECSELKRAISETENRLEAQLQMFARLQDENNHFAMNQKQLESELQNQKELRSVATQNADEALRKESQRKDDESVASQELASKLRDALSRAEAQVEELQKEISSTVEQKSQSLAQAEEEKRRMTAELHRSQSRVDSLTEMVRVLENGLHEERQEALHLGTALAESQEKRGELQEMVRLFTDDYSELKRAISETGNGFEVDFRKASDSLQDLMEAEAIKCNNICLQNEVRIHSEIRGYPFSPKSQAIKDSLELVTSNCKRSPRTASTSTRKSLATTPELRPRTRSQGFAFNSDNAQVILSISRKRMVESIYEGAQNSEHGITVSSESGTLATERRVTRSQTASTSGKKKIR